MIAEVVSNGMLSLPQAMAVAGVYLHSSYGSPSMALPGIITSIVLTNFLGIFGLFMTSILTAFKLNHPKVHNTGMCCCALSPGLPKSW
jgi:hypothetical protein